jgi:chromosome segregation ATPase
MLRFSWLLSAAILVSCAGCAEPPVEHTVRKVTAEDVRRDAESAADTATRAAIQAREELETRLTAGLADLDAEIARLREKGNALTDAAKTRWNERMADIEAKRGAARKKLDELGSSTGEAWARLEKGAQAAWGDVQKAVEEASKEF